MAQRSYAVTLLALALTVAASALVAADGDSPPPAADMTAAEHRRRTLHNDLHVSWLHA